MERYDENSRTIPSLIKQFNRPEEAILAKYSEINKKKLNTTI